MAVPATCRAWAAVAGLCLVLSSPNAAVFGQEAKPAESKPPTEAGADETILRDYLSGNGLLNRGLFELAAADYRKFLAEHANHEKAPVARYGLAVCLVRMEKHEEAIAELDRLQKIKDFTYAAETATLLGQARLALKQYPQAAEAFERVARDFGNHDLADDAAAGGVEALYLGGKYDAAAERCQMFTSRWPDSPLRERAEFFGCLAHVAKKDYAAAAERLAAFLQKFPQSPFAEQGTLLLAQCCEQRGEFDQAVQQYRRATQREEGRFMADALLGLGTLLLQQNKAAEAGKALDTLLEKFPQSPLLPSAKFQRGRVWFEQGRFEQASELFEQARDAKSLADHAAYWLAKCKLRQNEFAEAAKLFRQAIADFPQSKLLPEMNYDLGVALVRAGETEEAAKTLGDFRAKFPDHAMAAETLQMLAVTLHQQKKYEPSLKHCQAFLEKYPAHELAPLIAFLTAENSFLLGQYPQAVEGYRRFLEKYPKDAQVRKAKYRLGLALYRAQQPEEAQKFLAEIADAAKQEEALRPALLALGDIHFQRGEWKPAEKRLSEYLAAGLEAPSADDALLKLGLARQRDNRHEEAIRAYDLLLEHFAESPHRLQAVFERGQALVALKKWDEAGRAFERVLKEGADSRFAPYARNHLGAIALQRNDFAGAAEQFERVLEASPDAAMQAEALFQRGQALMAAQQFKPAEELFARFLKQAPMHARAPHALAQMAIAQARQDKHADAIKTIEQAEQQAADKLEPALRASLQYEKAWSLRALNKPEEAAAVYRKLLEANNQPEAGVAGDLSIHAMLELAEIEAGAKRYEPAVKLLKQLRAAIQKTDAGGTNGQAKVARDVREQGTYRLAACQFELSQFDEAIQLFEELIERFGDSKLIASASYFCGEALFKKGQHDRAAKHFTRVAEQFKADPACAPSLLRLGECLATLRNWPRSEQAFAEYLERFADGEFWFQAQFGLGWARENQGRHDEAIGAYRKVTDKHKGATAARAQFQIGECLFAKEKYEEAARELLKVDILYAYPEWSAAALYEAGRCFEKLSKPADARAQFKAVTDKYKDTRWATLAAQRLTALAETQARPGRP